MSKKTLEELAALLDFVKADLAGIEADYEDPFVEQLQNSASDQKSRRNNYLRNLEFSSKTNRFMRFASCVNFGKSLPHISMSRFA